MFDKRLFALVPQAKRCVLASVALRWLALLAQIAFCFALGRALGHVLQGAVFDAASVLEFAQAAGISLVLMLVFQTLSRWLAARAASAVQCSLSSALFGKLAALGSMREQTVSDSQALQLMGEGIELVKPYLSRYIPQFIYALLAPLTLFAVVAPINLLAAAVMLLCVPLMPVAIMLLMRRAKSFMGSYWGSYTDLGGAFLDAVKGLVTLMVFGSDAAEHKRLDQQAEEFRKVTMRLLTAQLGSVAFMDVFTFGGMAAGILVAAVQVSSGALQLQDALVIALLAGLFFTPMREFGSLFHTGMNARPVIDQLCTVIGAQEPHAGSHRLKTQQLTVEVKGLAFSYGAAAKRPALQGVDLEIHPNSFIGVSGPSGGGKSTLAKLLCGDLSGYRGSITFNGIELSQLHPGDVCRLVTVVSRQSHVFNGSFRSNLMIAAPNASDPQLWEALRQARMDEYVLECGGLDALVGAGGADLSGGQCQRLCFARALLRNTPLYIFDEATSNMDAQSEHVLMAAIQKLALSKTVIVLTHRLSQLKYADEILVMEAGRVAQRGVHQELLQQDGPYKRMWEQTAQLENFAQQVVEELPPEKPSAIQTALSKMPGMMQNMMTAFVSIIQAERYGNAAGDGLPNGHPAWIPLPDYRRGISEEETTPVSAASACSEELLEGEGNAAEPGGMGGFMEATLGDLENDEAEEIRQAMAVLKENVGKVPQTQVRVAAPPPAKHGIATIVGKLMRLTRDMLPELAASVALGFLGLAATVGVLAGGVACLLATSGLLAASLPLLVAGTVACALLRGPLHYVERLLTHDQTFKTLALIRSKVFGKLRSLGPGWLEAKDNGSLVLLLTGDVELLEGFYSRTCAPLLSAVLLGTAVTVVLTTLHPFLGAFALVAFALVAGVLPALSAAATRNRGAELHAYSVLMSGFMLDSLRGLPDLVRFGRAGEYRAELEQHMASLGGGEDAFGRLTAFLGAAPAALALLADAAAVALAAWLAASGALAVCQAVLGCVAFIAAMDSMRDVSGLGFSMHQTLAAADRVLDILAEDPPAAAAENGAVLGGFHGFEMRDVAFCYGNTQVLSGISLRIEPQSFVGIAGASGAGKSTLLKLMMRFWDATAGSVLINDVPLQQLQPASIRNAIAYMPQETYLFEGTLRRNLLVAKPDATQAQLQAAIEAAALAGLVERLPQGLDTAISGAGEDLSSGERQRVGLARAFLCDAPLMLLDEPTSNLDALNEAAILRALCANAQGKTVVIVSHRKAVAAIVDKLLVVETEDRES